MQFSVYVYLNIITNLNPVSSSNVKQMSYLYFNVKRQTP